MAWWELTEEQIANNPIEAQLRYCAYFNTFMASDEGRAVLYDLMRESGMLAIENLQKNPDNAMKYAVLSEFIAKIKRKCGIESMMDVIKAEAQISAAYIPLEPQSTEQKQDLL